MSPVLKQRLKSFIFSGFCRKMWMLCVALLALGSVHSVNGDSKAVTTTLTTKWPSTPLLLEASEFLAEESQDKFWDFVEANQNIEKDHDDYQTVHTVHILETDLAYYDLILKRASVLLSPVQLNLLKFALSLRAYSSTVHSFQQIASNEPPPPGCKAFFNVHGQTSCDTERLKVMLDNALERILQVPSADAGQNQQGPDHLRFTPLCVAGADVNATVIGENDPVDEVQGFLFGKLKTIYPELKEQLKELRKHLIESTNEMAPLKVWQMQGFIVVSAFGSETLAAERSSHQKVYSELDVLSLYCLPRSITKTVVNSEIRKEIEENQKYFKGTLGLQPGDSALFINGLHIDLDVQDIFSVFDILRNEARVMEGLRSLLIDTPYIHDILKLNVQPSDSDYAVDIRSPAVNVMILDPTHENTAELISVAEMFYSNNIPLRIGVVFVVNDLDEVDGMKDAGVALLRAFNYIADDVDSQAAFDAMISVSQQPFQCFTTSI
ncbi:UDP-glucose:glycoprotein glucosyltransferase 1 [Labeo rohita]|uniref:UDP-glucose:glycoprotein glucosyltransferase 1 n=1 Tax=Labeo rohita TaxID=84645 RepID=A0ABQ8MY79_LABRO|nr:UDP-glucose:glycoprotein glucosyltransferase 1 [Labeo rohita]